MAKDKPKYTQLEPAAFLSDEDYQMMTDAERGIYCTVIFYMYCNNGRIRNQLDAIKRLCNSNSNFEQKWESVRSKFYQKGVWLRHRRVDFELKNARRLMQVARASGVEGARRRWGPHKEPQGNPIAKVSKVKVSKVKVSKEEDNNSIFSHWNSYRAMRGWKSHTKLTPEIKKAIRDRLKEYSVDDIKGAIDNYAKVLLSKEYKWSYAWTLYQFLTRHSPQNRKELQLYRWLPNSFYETDYLTDNARRQRQEARLKPQPDSAEKHKPPTDEEKAEIRTAAEKAMPRLKKQGGKQSTTTIIN